jgi:hypothetical protein
MFTNAAVFPDAAHVQWSLLMGYFQGVVYPTNSMNRLTDADIPRFYK